MYKKQVVFQRIVCFISLVAGALVFVYSLGLLTDLFDTLYSMIPNPNNLDSAKVEGARIYYDMQPFNRTLLRGSIGMILLSCALFMTNTHSRRKYYIGNTVATAVNVAAECAMAIWCHLEVSAFKTQYLTTVDFAELEKRLSRRGTYTDSTFWFDIHYLVCGVAILAAVLLIVNYFWKKKMMREEQKLLRSSGKAVSA
ncbi:MAG: hypothetical protein IKN04_13950 [Clostridia bacterium]|nr:hypothetical protein [Clostridia bacterium]